MENLSHLFAAYAAIWIILFGYIWRLRSRQKTLQQEIALLQQRLAEDREKRTAQGV